MKREPPNTPLQGHYTVAKFTKYTLTKRTNRNKLNSAPFNKESEEMTLKKITALLMVLVVLLSTAALAEGTQVYTHPVHGYSITVPSDWLCVDSQNIQQLITDFENGTFSFMGTDIATLKNLALQMQQMDFAVLSNANSFNIVISFIDLGVAMNQDTFITTLVPILKADLAASFPSMEFSTVGEPLTLGDNHFVVIAGEYSMNGINMAMDQLYMLNGTRLYVLNLTTTPLWGEATANEFYADAVEACATFVPAP